MRIHSFHRCNSPVGRPCVRAGAGRARHRLRRPHLPPPTRRSCVPGGRLTSVQRRLSRSTRPRTCRLRVGTGRVQRRSSAFRSRATFRSSNPQTYLYYMRSTDLVSLPSQKHVEAVQRSGSNKSSSATTSCSGRRTSSTISRSRRSTTSFSNGVIGKNDRLQHGGASAHQEHRLQRGDEGNRAGEGRRAAS